LLELGHWFLMSVCKFILFLITHLSENEVDIEEFIIYKITLRLMFLSLFRIFINIFDCRYRLISFLVIKFFKVVLKFILIDYDFLLTEILWEFDVLDMLEKRRNFLLLMMDEKFKNVFSNPSFRVEDDMRCQHLDCQLIVFRRVVNYVVDDLR
jgi:hypothetical protein